MAEHEIAPLGEIHRWVNWEFANTAARTGAVGILPADIGKIAKQTDDGTYWELIDDSPLTWSLVGGTIPQVSKSANYTLTLSERGCHLLHPVGDNNPRTFTIPENSSVPFPIGTAITFVNKINSLTIAITTDTLTWAEDGSTGSRTLAAPGMATVLKIAATEWMISGTGLA